MNDYCPKTYYSKNRTLEWGKSLTNEQRTALKDGEMFVLLDTEGQPYSEVLMDSFNVIRERRLLGKQVKPEIDCSYREVEAQ